MNVYRYVLVVLALSMVAAVPGQAAQGHAPETGGPRRTSGKTGEPGPGGGMVATRAGHAAQGQAPTTGGPPGAPGQAGRPGKGHSSIDGTGIRAGSSSVKGTGVQVRH